MTHAPDPARAERLEAYLDGRLTGEHRAAFEAELASDAALRAELELQRGIDAALRRRFAPPEMISLPASSQAAAPRRSRRLWRPLAVAAAAALLAAGAWAGWAVYSVSVDPLVSVYRSEVAAGLRPKWVCDTDEQLAEYLQDKFGRTLVVRSTRPDVSLIGWTSCSLMSPYTAVLLTRVGGEPVLVLVDRAEVDTRPSLPPLSGLRLFRREVGGMVLYELSPLDHPTLLDAFAKPPCRSG